MGWRVRVEANQVLLLLGEGGVVRALEGADPTLLKPIGRPDPLHGAPCDADHLGHCTPSPVGDLTGRLGAGQGQHLRHRAGGQRLLARRLGLVVQQPLDAFFAVALLPVTDRRLAHASLLRDLPHRQAFAQ